MVQVCTQINSFDQTLASYGQEYITIEPFVNHFQLFAFSGGSVVSSCPEGGSDNEDQQPQQQPEQDNGRLNNNLDAIAEVLFQHPAIRNAVANFPE